MIFSKKTEPEQPDYKGAIERYEQAAGLLLPSPLHCVPVRSPGFVGRGVLKGRTYTDADVALGFIVLALLKLGPRPTHVTPNRYSTLSH